MSTLWKACLISSQVNFVPLQYHVDSVSKSSRLAVVVSARSYVIIMRLLFILGILAQVGAHPKEMKNTSRNPLDVLPLGHLLRRLARVSKSSWRLKPSRLRVCLGILEQPALRWMSRLYTSLVFYVLHMNGKLRR